MGDSCAVSLRSVRQRPSEWTPCGCCVDTSCWCKIGSTQSISLGIAVICKHECVRSRIAVESAWSSKTLIHRLRGGTKNVVQAYTRWAQQPLHSTSEHVLSASDIATLIPFFFLLPPRSLRTVCSLTYRGTSTCGTPCQEVCWSYQSTPLTSHISLSTTWD